MNDLIYRVVLIFLVATTASVMSVQSVTAFPFPGCTSCAKDFAPGQEKNTAESNFDSGAKAFAPGQEAKLLEELALFATAKNLRRVKRKKIYYKVKLNDTKIKGDYSYK